MKNRIRRIHMVGIGGAGMSGIAEILLNLGYEISGSDLTDSAMVKHLRLLGATVAIGHAAGNVGNVQVLVKSTAVAADNPEVEEARRRNIAIIPRAEMLAELMRLRQGIAIAGTHGKTTTTSLAACIFDTAGLDPTVIIGGRLNVYGANARLGRGEYLIAEADESDGSFLCLLPIINIVTNVDSDHLDYYKSREAIDAAFAQFMNKVPFYGVNVVCGDDPGIRALLPGVKRPFITYGFGDGNRLRAVPISCNLQNLFEVWLDGEQLGEVNLPQPGHHNILNALGAIGAALEAGIPFQDCILGLKAFAGVARRFEFKGERNGVTVVDDYGHHPAEIAATLVAARQVFPGRRLVVAFQPHRFTRTQALFGEFCRAFDSVDLLLLTEIYPAGEKPVPGVSGQSLAQGIRQVSTTPVILFQTLETLAHNLPAQLRAGDVLLTLGAGTITRLGPKFLEIPDA
ncbi:MAG: UDP-N-acetylmuramate--L-alanine ligase [Desulfovibrio sp.]|jgi:UDP-N-acetylmuramate--alanine ligase|nr:UDP-N-acetylmuramate--L-alanine ligase [Desulfovibrio sp.]